MTSWFVTRHQGAIQWFSRRNIKIDRVIDHLDPELIKSGDIVYGVLPFAVAAELCRNKVAFYSMALNVPKEERGKELTAEMLEAFGCELIRYEVKELERIR